MSEMPTLLEIIQHTSNKGALEIRALLQLMLNIIYKKSTDIEYDFEIYFYVGAHAS